MSGSRLGRGRGGRLAVYGGCGVVVVLLIFLYRAATSEMARLRDLHVQCAHQQEALAAQLQVIFEYKVRLEKSLAEEKSSNAAVKQELQERASREKSLRDKDSVEAMRRFHSLQQTYKILQTEHQDLQDECKKRQKQALEDTMRLEATLQDLRSRIRQSEDKDKALEQLKSKYMEMDNEKSKLERKYNDMLQSTGNTDIRIDHLKKEVFQLRRELEEAKKATQKGTSPKPSPSSVQDSQQVGQQPEGKAEQQADVQRASDVAQRQQQQVSRPNNDDESPQPLPPPRQHRGIGAPLSNEETLPNEVPSNVGFAQKGGNIVPVGPNDANEDALPLPYDLREKRRQQSDKVKENADREGAGKDVGGKGEEEEEEEEEEENRKIQDPGESKPGKDAPLWKQPSIGSLVRPIDAVSVVTPKRATGEKREEEDELRSLQNQSVEAASSIKSIPALKPESSTKSSSGNPGSTSFDRALPLPKPASKVKLPVGVVPIPLMMDKQQDEARKEEQAEDTPARNHESKENEPLMENGNQAFVGGQQGRHIGAQVHNRRANAGWLRGVPVQEIGDVLNNVGRGPGLDDGAERQADAGDDPEYDAGDFEKDPQLKNSDLHLARGEEEGEDEENELDYPMNMKQKK